MSYWTEYVEYIYEVSPSIEEAFPRKWMYEQAKNVTIDSTHPCGASPVAGILLKLSEQGNRDEILTFGKILKAGVEKNAKRIKELKSKDAFASGVVWQALSELALLSDLFSTGLKIDYDNTSDSRTPDFLFVINNEIVGIEHTAPDEGSYIKTNRKLASDSLKVAREATKLLSDAKLVQQSIADSSVADLLTREENSLLAQALGRKIEAGKSPPEVTKDEIEREIGRHKDREIEVFSAAPYVATRNPDLKKSISYIRNLKIDGGQVRNCKWKILALSLPGQLYSGLQTERLIKHNNECDPELSIISSGSIWHAILGVIGDSISSGINKCHLDDGVLYKIKKLEENGSLVDKGSPWHAVIVSIFTTGTHRVSRRDALSDDLDVVVPHNLSSTRYLYIRNDERTLPDHILNFLKNTFQFRAVYSRASLEPLCLRDSE